MFSVLTQTGLALRGRTSAPPGSQPGRVVVPTLTRGGSMSGAGGGTSKGCSIVSHGRVLSARAETHTDADRQRYVLDSPERTSLVPRFRPVPRHHLGTETATVAQLNTPYTVLYSLMLFWYCSLSTHSG